MGGGNSGHNGQMGPRHARQGGDFARRIHADFNHREIRLARHPRQSQRHAPVIVIGGNRSMHPPQGCEGCAHHFFTGGFANRPRNCNHLPRHTRAPCAPQILKRGLHILYKDQGRILCNAVRNAGDQRA